MQGKSLWNVATVALLCMVAAGVYTMPRFNYQTLVGRQVAVETRQNEVEEKLATLNLLAGANKEDRRYALVGMLDSLPGLIASLDNSHSALREEQSALLKRSQDLALRVDRWEEKSPALPETDRPKTGSGLSDAGAELTASYTELITLPEELKAKANAFSARAAAERPVEDFLRQALENGLLPFASLEAIPPAVHQALHRAFAVYKCTIDLVNFEETLHIRQLVEEASGRGEYSDIPYDSNGGDASQSVKADRAVLFAKDSRPRQLRYSVPCRNLCRKAGPCCTLMCSILLRDHADAGGSLRRVVSSEDWH